MSKRRSPARRLPWLLVAGLVAGALLIPAVMPVSANNLHQSPPIAWNAPGYADADCPDLDEGQVLWHFVHTGTDGSDLPASITVKTSAGDVTVDGYSNGNGNAIVMYDVYSGQTTLLDADDTIVDDNLLNLSHICVGPDPSEEPSVEPSVDPSVEPSVDPSVEPSVDPSVEPSVDPSVEPSVDPSVEPSVDPSVEPSVDPSVEPSVDPSVEPSVDPSVEPSVDPSVEPSVDPSVEPSVDPSVEPSVDPSVEPSVDPSVEPSVDPSVEPSVDPSVEPSGDVEAETGTPAVTLPPTDTLASGAESGTNLQIVLLGMAGLLTVVLLVTPAGVVKRSKR